MDEDVPDTTLVQLVLNRLPQSFDVTISSISNMDALPTLDGIRAKLISVAHRMQQRSLQLGEEDQEALLTRSQQGRRKARGGSSQHGCKSNNQDTEDKQSRASPICYYYGKTRHIARNYLDNKYRPLEKKNKHVNSVEESDDSEHEELEASIMEFTQSLDNHNWFLDSGASKHIISDSSKLDITRENSARGRVQAVGNEPHAVQARGFATLSTKEGEIKLSNVLHVPSISKNYSR